MQVSFGVKRPMSEAPRLTTFAFPEPLAIGGATASWAFLNVYGFDPSMAPIGKTAVTVNFWASSTPGTSSREIGPPMMPRRSASSRTSFHGSSRSIRAYALTWR